MPNGENLPWGTIIVVSSALSLAGSTWSSIQLSVINEHDLGMLIVGWVFVATMIFSFFYWGFRMLWGRDKNVVFDKTRGPQSYWYFIGLLILVTFNLSQWAIAGSEQSEEDEENEIRNSGWFVAFLLGFSVLIGLDLWVLSGFIKNIKLVC